VAILSQPQPGRSACINCGFCLAFGCEVGAKSSSLATAIRVAERPGRCEIRPNSYVPSHRNGCEWPRHRAVYFDEKRNTHLQKAKAVVVCGEWRGDSAAAFALGQQTIPNGLANSSGFVGKNLMLNSGGVTVGGFEHPLNDYKGSL